MLLSTTMMTSRTQKRFPPLLAFSAVAIVSALSYVDTANAFHFGVLQLQSFRASHSHPSRFFLAVDASEGSSASNAAPPPPKPLLNGKLVLPFKIISAGLKGQDDNVAAVYAILNSSYKKAAGDAGWAMTEYVGVTQDLNTALSTLQAKYGSDQVAHVRALSFSFPQPNAMQDAAREWKDLAKDAGADLEKNEAVWSNTVADALSYLYDDDDEDDDDEIDEDFELDLEMTSKATASVASNKGASNAVVSPFDEDSKESSESAVAASHEHVSEDGDELKLTRENVDKVLDEVRPYLISDGGNVSVERVEEDTGDIYLKLEGACGSCESSTVTMQMGIERVLKENFGSALGQVLQVKDEDAVTELTLEVVEEELARLAPAIAAMGSVMELIGIEKETGVVNMKFRGANKVQQGLELALTDLKFVNKVNFITGDD